MKVAVIGNGGREHTLCWKIAQSKKVNKIYAVPGNAGTADYAENIDIAVDQTDVIADFCIENGISLVVVGPELPLTLGLVDQLEAAGIDAFGPSVLAAEIEGSKDFSKRIMEKYGVPTAKYQSFTEFEQAKLFLEQIGIPCVIKADGLAQGKGVFVCLTKEDADNALIEIMGERSFGDAGNRVVIEEYLEGQEVSVLAFTDGKTFIPMVSAQDHKRIFDEDQGLNTGGMGAYSPAPMYTRDIEEFVNQHVFLPVIQGMEKEGRLYKGVLYAGLMLTKDGVKVLEFNARFGDPETQVVLTRLESDLVDIMIAVNKGRLQEADIRWKEDAAVCVVMSAEGYPGPYKNGTPVSFTDPKPQIADCSFVFHAGTKKVDGQTVTNGGRVFGVTATGKTIQEAIANAYLRVDSVSFDGAHYRRDIGKKALAFL